MSTSRNELTQELSQYISVTFRYIKTVKVFMSRSPQWMSSRMAEAKKMTKAKEKSAESPTGEEELGYKDDAALEIGLEETLSGLEEMHIFLHALEMLAVTSVDVFEQNQDPQAPDGAELRAVQQIIHITQLLCPLLILFKRDSKAFFKAKLGNIEMLQSQLNMYITTIQVICDALDRSPLKDFCFDFIMIVPNYASECDTEKILSTINKLHRYRMDEDFRLLFLFQDQYKVFMEEFKKREEQMLQCLRDIEACAVQLDSMNKGARISSVVGSSVGAISGVLSIVGFALIPVTLGASLALVGTGAGLAAVSGANSIVTTATEAGVNRTQIQKANETLKKCMENANVLQNSLNEVVTQHFNKLQNNTDLRVRFLGAGMRLMRSVDLIMDVVQAASKGAVAISRAARGGLIALNALFIGVDAFFIVKDGIALSKGSETEVSKYLRATAALWESEITAWQKMYKSLKKCLKVSYEIQFIVEEPFHK